MSRNTWDTWGVGTPLRVPHWITDVISGLDCCRRDALSGVIVLMAASPFATVHGLDRRQWTRHSRKFVTNPRLLLLLLSEAADKLPMAKRLKVRSASSRAYSIYIIELARTCLQKSSAYAPLYVGQTAHTPEHRFAQHKAGGKLAAGKAHKFGLRLRYDLMKGIGPFSTRAGAERAEKALAEALKRRGHRVFWG